MTHEHPIPGAGTPLDAYQLAARTMSLACQREGASAASDRLAPRRMSFGWWSPLFDVVLRPGGSHA
ncbi:MAG TPA: hypothetical protein DHV93_05985 [Holophagaceae bacterium]|nr:hypothetical protein [Holophagaceae bacterium]